MLLMFIASLHNMFNSVEGSEDGSELLAEGGLRLVRGVEPTGEALEGSGSLISVGGLLSVFVAALDELSLVVVPPHHFQISMDVELLRVGDVELLNPAGESLAAAVSVEGAGDPLRVEPLESTDCDVSAVLFGVASLLGVPLSVDSEFGTLADCQELHSGHGTHGVPVGVLYWIAFGIDSERVGRREVLALAGANPVDFPRTGSPLLLMELAPSTYHFRPSISFVGVHVVILRFLHLVDVHVRSKTEDVAVMAAHGS